MAVKERSNFISTFPNAIAPQVDMVAGRVVTIGANGVVAYANTTNGQGILAQDVKSPEHLDIIRLGKNTAFYGGKVGVYMDGGLFETDQTAVAVTAGATLYSDANGMLTTDNATGTAKPIAEALTSANAGEFVWIKLLV